MSQFNDQNHFTDCVYFSVQMRSFLFLPFLQALDTASPPDLFKVHLVVFQTFSVLLHLTGLPLWPSWKARHRSRGTRLSSMERVGRRCWCNAQAGRSTKRLKHCLEIFSDDSLLQHAVYRTGFLEWWPENYSASLSGCYTKLKNGGFNWTSFTLTNSIKVRIEDPAWFWNWKSTFAPFAFPHDQ